MKKILGFLFLLALSAAGAQAQTPMLAASPQVSGHSVSLSWTQSVAGAKYNLYKAPCSVATTGGTCPSASEGTFVKVLNETSGTIYLDLSVQEGQSYSYYVTSVCSAAACGNSPSGAPYAGESAHSNHVGVTIPFSPVPPPPPTLSITSVAVNFKAGSQTVFVAWRGDSSSTYTLTSRKGTLLEGSARSDSGRYFFEWSGRRQQELAIRICDSLNRCISQNLG